MLARQPVHFDRVNNAANPRSQVCNTARLWPVSSLSRKHGNVSVASSVHTLVFTRECVKCVLCLSLVTYILSVTLSLTGLRTPQPPTGMVRWLGQSERAIAAVCACHCCRFVLRVWRLAVAHTEMRRAASFYVCLLCTVLSCDTIADTYRLFVGVY